ncbi:hypothetical protein C0989_007439 [Termitomyces sp. Mn162]|nr:hypothetical protein C0989_007439 [Termitomyces sp. Mn162]
MSSQVGISVPAALIADAMEVDNNGLESITALMQSLMPPQQLYPLLPTGTCPSDVLSTLSSVLGQSTVASTSKGKGKATATLLPAPAQEDSTPPSTTWKMFQLALSQVLNELDVVQSQRDEACVDLFCSALEKGKWIATPPNPPEAKKAHTKPSVFVEEFSTQRAPLILYDDIVPAGNNQSMDKHPDFKVALSSAGPSKPVVAKVKPPKPAATKEGMSKPSTKKAGTGQASAMVTKADDSTVITTPIALPANVPQGTEAIVIEVLKLRTYVMPGVLPQEYSPPVHQDPYNKEFYVTQPAAAQAMAGAPAAPDSGSNDEEDDDVPTFKQCILDSDFDDDANECWCKKQHNANAKWLLAIDTEKSKWISSV